MSRNKMSWRKKCIYKLSFSSCSFFFLNTTILVKQVQLEMKKKATPQVVYAGSRNEMLKCRDCLRVPDLILKIFLVSEAIHYTIELDEWAIERKKEREGNNKRRRPSQLNTYHFQSDHLKQITYWETKKKLFIRVIKRIKRIIFDKFWRKSTTYIWKQKAGVYNI